jgi:glycogen operon protein
MEWYDEHGETMSIDKWNSPAHRTLQYVAASTPEFEEANRILLVVHGRETPIDVTLPDLPGALFVTLWSSADERPTTDAGSLRPGDVVAMPPTSMRLFRVDVDPDAVVPDEHGAVVDATAPEAEPEPIGGA